MGISGNKTSKTEIIKSEMFLGNKPIPIKLDNEVMKSICKIIIKKKGEIIQGTGFFMKNLDTLKYLITNYHVINPHIGKENIEIEIWNKKIMKLNLNNRHIKYIERPRDITVIEIKPKDEIYGDIEYLTYDLNYKQGYLIYKNLDIFTIEHPNGEDASCASGKIIDIEDYEFFHNISTDNGSSGCPIILLSNNMNLKQVIGIHKDADYSKKLNGGTFIGEIFNEINNNSNYIENKINNNIDINKNKNNNNKINININNKKNKKNINKDKKKKNTNDDNKKKYNNNNYIIASLHIKSEDINKDIRIINSYEEFSKTGSVIKDNIYKNENEIKRCIIKINDILIPFNYFHKFYSEGVYNVKYLFNVKINNADLMFANCNLLIDIDLSNFNSDNVTNINGMFFGCSSLTQINLSNFNTNKVIDMHNMFNGTYNLQRKNVITTDNKILKEFDDSHPQNIDEGLLIVNVIDL